MRFKKGDRVEVKEDAKVSCAGMKGVVVEVNEGDNPVYQYQVMMDKERDNISWPMNGNELKREEER